MSAVTVAAGVEAVQPVSTPAADGRLRRGATRVGRIVAALVLVAFLGALLATVVVPRVAGATPFTILTGSMRPHLPPGTLVVVRPAADAANIPVGTVVTYQLNSGDPTVVTHRIVAERSTLTGQVQYQTKGDANPVPDPAWVEPVQVRGTLWYAVPWLGRLNVLVSQSAHQLGVYAAAGVLGLYALTMFAGAGRDRRRGQPTARRGGAHRA